MTAPFAADRPRERLGRIALGLLLTASPAAAQRVAGVVFSPGTRPLAGAEVTFYPRPEQGLRGLPARQAPAEPRRALTDDQGRYRIDGVESEGCLLVTHESGVGAVIAGAAPGAPDRIDTRPLGEVRVRDGGRLVADVAALPTDRPPCHLGRFETEALRLPPGSYRMLLRAGARWSEATCHVGAGQRVELEPPPASERVLRLPEGFAGDVFLASWGGNPLPRTGDEIALPPRGVPALLQLHEHAGPAVAVRQIWVPPEAASVEVHAACARWRPLTVRAPDGEPLEGTQVLTFDATAQGLLPVGYGVSGPDGRAPVRVDGQHVLVHARGFAPRILDAPHGADVVQLARGYERAVRITGLMPGDGAVEVELACTDEPWLVFAAHTDRRGNARFRDLPAGPGVLRLRSANHLPAEREVVVPAAEEPCLLAADSGGVLRGRVELGGAGRLAAVLVTLRDTAGAEHDARVAYTDEQGRFAFRGLPREALFTVSASAEEAGRTWSAQLRGVQAEDGTCVLALRLEDPVKPGREQFRNGGDQ